MPNNDVGDVWGLYVPALPHARNARNIVN